MEVIWHMHGNINGFQWHTSSYYCKRNSPPYPTCDAQHFFSRSTPINHRHWHRQDYISLAPLMSNNMRKGKWKFSEMKRLAYMKQSQVRWSEITAWHKSTKSKLPSQGAWSMISLFCKAQGISPGTCCRRPNQQTTINKTTNTTK